MLYYAVAIVLILIIIIVLAQYRAKKALPKPVAEQYVFIATPDGSKFLTRTEGTFILNSSIPQRTLWKMTIYPGNQCMFADPTEEYLANYNGKLSGIRTTELGDSVMWNISKKDSLYSFSNNGLYLQNNLDLGPIANEWQLILSTGLV